MSSFHETYLRALKARYGLTDKQSDNILQYIIKNYTYQISSVDHPTVIILGAQPGAGKTELQKEAEFRLLKNTVICNADNFRDFHPQTIEIKKKHEIEYPEITSEYSKRWNDALCKYCREHKLNYILETTFNSGDRLNQTITEIKKDGYQVDIDLLAVDPRLSLLGTYLRYETMRSISGMGRKVSKEAHDSRFEAIPDTIKKVQEAKLYDNFYVHARSIFLEGTKQEEGVTLVAHNPTNPLAVYKEELHRKWSVKLDQYFKDQYEVVLKLMAARKASIKEVDEFKKNIELGQLIKQQHKRRLRL